MKFVKWAGALGALATMLLVAGCGSSGTAPDGRVTTPGGLDMGLNAKGLRADLGQNVCVRWDLYQAPLPANSDSTNWNGPRTSDGWICGGDGQDFIEAGWAPCRVSGGVGWLYFVEYEIAFCGPEGNASDQGPCSGNDRVIFRSRAAAKGHCATDYSNVPAYAKVQFDNRLEEQGGVDPQIDIDQVCWNYKLDIDVACVDNPQLSCVTFGLLMGPSDCQTGAPDSYCVLGHTGGEDPFVTRLQTVTDPAFDPVISVLLTDLRMGDGFSLLFGSFAAGLPAYLLRDGGFELYNAPWLLHVNGSGPSSWTDPSDNITNFNRSLSYRTAGSWLYSNGDGAQSFGFITAGFPSESNAEPPPGTNQTFVFWDWSPSCDNGALADANMVWWNAPEQLCDEAETLVIKGVVKTHGSAFNIVYACAQVDEVTGEVNSVGSLWKVACDAAGLNGTGWVCDCSADTTFNPPVWYMQCLEPNFTPL